MPISVNYIYYKLFFVFLLFILPNEIYGQFFLYSETPVDISTSFNRHSISAKAQQPIFNVLKIKNNSNRTESFTLNITVPQGWNVIGLDRFEISINPLDSIYIPIRVAVGSSVRGDIGYSIIASLSDSRGNTIKNEYCFVKIPRETDLNIRIIDRIAFLDPVSDAASFSIRISNKGNRDETVTMIFDGNRRLDIGENKQSIVSYDYIIPPYTDTTFTYRAELSTSQDYGRNMYGLNATFTTIDTIQRSTLWFRKIDSKYKNFISSSDKPLTIEVIGQGLLDAANKPVVSMQLEGRTLLNKESEVYYYYKNMQSKSYEDFYENTRMHIGGKIGNWNVEVGDNYRTIEALTFGRGGYLSFNNEKITTEFLANSNTRTGVDNFGGSFDYTFNSTFRVFSGAIYSNGYLSEFDSKLGFVGSNFSLFKKHKFKALFGYNLFTKDIEGRTSNKEFGAELNYSSTIGAVQTTINSKFGTPFYYSPYGGRANIFANSLWLINHKNSMLFQYLEDQNKRPTIQGSIITSNIGMVNRMGKVEHQYLYSSAINLFYGLAVENFRWDNLPSFITKSTFNSINNKLIIGARIKNPANTFIITPKFEISQAQITSNPFITDENLTSRRNNFSYQFFSINYRDRSFNILAFYTSGPRSAFDQMQYANVNRPTRKLQFLPAFDRYVYKDIVRVYAGISYTNDIVAKSSYTNITGQVYWDLPRNWRIYTLGVYSLQKRTTPQEVVESFQNLYVEASIRKEFDIQHPRIKYYDVKLVFFKDFNGNFVQEPNEPGIKNVLASIQLEEVGNRGKIPGDFYSAELMSDNLGNIYLEKIPEGRYKISYNAIGNEAGTYSKAIEDSYIIVDHSGVYLFPFVEKNKVFGKIIHNRSRLSGLGRIDLANVRITATDSHGRSYSTLTDRNGEFVLFAPVTDEYILNINNIFYENFDLRQNNFLVQFNGYKQFEVNFVFDEKIRRINFAATDSELQGGVQQIRRTIISGTVKDANTQQPVRARVNLVNSRTNSVVITTNSSATNGDYTLSFIAGDNYVLEVLADDYWYMSENLVLQQVTTFMNITRDVMLRPVSIGSTVELNIRFEPNSAFLAPESVAELNRLLRQIKNNPTVKLEIQGHSDDLEAIQKPGISLERANAVGKYLIENGYSNLQIKDMKNTAPTSTNDTEEGRFRNRRIEVVVISR
jgi:outer membrane protein OmpA-like peptidoglycan-associated protein